MLLTSHVLNCIHVHLYAKWRQFIHSLKCHQCANFCIFNTELSTC